jgi:hypothetical protein
MTAKKLTVADLPKKYLVGMVERMNIPIKESDIARAIVHERMVKAGALVAGHDEKMAAAKKIRAVAPRKAMEIKAVRQYRKAGALMASARLLAEQFDLDVKKYFRR